MKIICLRCLLKGTSKFSKRKQLEFFLQQSGKISLSATSYLKKIIYLLGFSIQKLKVPKTQHGIKIFHFSKLHATKKEFLFNNVEKYYQAVLPVFTCNFQLSKKKNTKSSITITPSTRIQAFNRSQRNTMIQK